MTAEIRTFPLRLKAHLRVALRNFGGRRALPRQDLAQLEQLGLIARDLFTGEYRLTEDGAHVLTPRRRR